MRASHARFLHVDPAEWASAALSRAICSRMFSRSFRCRCVRSFHDVATRCKYVEVNKYEANKFESNKYEAGSYTEHQADDHVPEDIHPRTLIIAIQQNLGITKKEISERTGISYGTLNRYTRRSEDIGRPRQSSMQRLINLYRISLKRYGTAPDRDEAATRHPGAEYRRSLIGSAPNPLADLNLRGLDPNAVARFVAKALFYASGDVEHFRESGLRDRSRLEAAQALLGDAYTALVHESVTRDFVAAPPREAAPEATDTSDDEADARETAPIEDRAADGEANRSFGNAFDTSDEPGA